MKKILVINSGSSSLKFQLIAMPQEAVLASGIIERIGFEDAILKFNAAQTKQVEVKAIKSHEEAMKEVVAFLLDKQLGLLRHANEIDMIGHRVVHGGSHFTDTTLINEEVKTQIKQLSNLAPLHNPPNLIGIEVAERFFPNAKQVAVFDTAFHQTIPPKAYTYALPKQLSEAYGIRLYGFHGTSHKFVSEKAAQFLHNPTPNLIILHLGNGCSMTALAKGKSIDHSLGFGPVTGLIMGTRSGDIDPAVLLFLMEKGFSFGEINDLLNKKSGMLGLTGDADLREIQARYLAGDEDCKLALEMNAYRTKKYIGAYMAALNGADALVFTAGIGENSALLRSMICKEMDYLGIVLDEAKNQVQSNEIREIQAQNARVKILVIPTNEELEIAKQAFALTTFSA